MEQPVTENNQKFQNRKSSCLQEDVSDPMWLINEWLPSVLQELQYNTFNVRLDMLINGKSSL